MANKDLFKQAIADAKSIREAAIANAKLALEESLTPQLKELLAQRLAEMEEEEAPAAVISEEEVTEEATEEVAEEVEEETLEEAIGPDGLVSSIVDHSEVWLFGTNSVEVWYNAGTADSKSDGWRKSP